MVLRKTSRYQVYAVAISYVSLGASVAELALFLTAYDLSLSLYGVALMAITDISGDLLILTQWQGRAEESSFTSSKELREARTAQQLMEVWASFTVGIFLFICALFLLADSIKSVVVASRQSLGTDEMGLGMAASVLGVICGSLLSAYKFKIARELESSTVLANAISSQCSAMTGAAAIVSALLDSFWSSLDSVLGAAVASYTLHQGVTIMMSARTDLRDLRDDRLHRSFTLLHQQQHQKYLHSTFAGLALSAGASPGATPLSSAPSSSTKRVRFEDESPRPDVGPAGSADHLLTGGAGAGAAATAEGRRAPRHHGNGNGLERGALPTSAARTLHNGYDDDDDDGDEDDGGGDGYGGDSDGYGDPDPEAALRDHSARSLATPAPL